MTHTLSTSMRAASIDVSSGESQASTFFSQERVLHESRRPVLFVNRERHRERRVRTMPKLR